MTNSRKEIGLGISLIPILFLISTLFVIIFLYKQKAHIALLLATAVAVIVAVANKYPWREIQDGMVTAIQLAMGAILILMIIGTMISTWIMGGIVPSMIYYGLQLLSPGIFLVATLIICSIISLGTGSSWSTAGTVGVALIAVGKGLGIPVPMVAGAIISGAYFGDKMSPLSDTTNLAPAVSGTDVFTHIRHMIYTTTPGYVIALILYAILGFRFAGKNMNTGDIENMLATLKSNFDISIFMLIPPILIIVMVWKKIPPLPALFGGTVLGGLFAILFQSKSLSAVLNVAFSGFTADTGSKMVNELLSGGGLIAMMDTVALIICALCFGGVMERTGMLNTIAKSLLKRAKSTGSLVLTTVFSCISMNIIAAEQYMAIVIPGRMFKPAFDARGLHPKNLSRCLEDSATLTSPLIPWNSCGAFMFATLGVSPFAYLPYAFMNLANPLISIFYGYTGITMHKVDDEKEPESISDKKQSV